MNNKCYFSDWEVLPAEFDPSSLKLNNEGGWFETERHGRSSCVVQGKDEKHGKTENRRDIDI